MFEAFHWLDAVACLAVALVLLINRHGRGWLAYVLMVSAVGVSLFTLYDMPAAVEAMASVFDITVLILVFRTAYNRNCRYF